MRPGLLCPGSPVSGEANSCGRKASMRPGLLCPGRSRRMHARAPHRRFNEAGAVMPRKGVRRFRPRPIGEASMRPGLLCPGRSRQLGLENV